MPFPYTRLLGTGTSMQYYGNLRERLTTSTTCNNQSHKAWDTNAVRDSENSCIRDHPLSYLLFICTQSNQWVCHKTFRESYSSIDYILPRGAIATDWAYAPREVGRRCDIRFCITYFLQHNYSEHSQLRDIDTACEPKGPSHNS